MIRGRSVQGSFGSVGTAASGMIGARAAGQPPAFPKMPIDEIVEDMALFKRPVSRELIRSPTAEGVKAVFQFFLEHMYGVTEEKIRQPAVGCLDALDYPELHDESIPILQFLRACQKMFAAAQYPGFGIRDFVRPASDRFHWQLSALINYAKFRENRLRFFSEMSLESEQLRESRAQKANEFAEIKQRIEAIEEVRASEEPAIAKENESIGELSAELSALHKQQLALTEEMREKKSSLQATIDHIAKLNFQKLAGNQELETLRGCVVSSPDRVRSEIRETSERIETEQESIHVLQQQIHTLQRRAETVGKSGQDVLTVSKLAEEAVHEMEHVKEMEQRQKDVKAKIRECENEKDALESSNKHLERQIKSVEQRLGRVRQQRGELTERARATENTFAAQSREADRKKAEADRAIAKNNQRAAVLTENIKSLVREFASDVDAMTKALATLDRKMVTFFKDVKETDGLVDAENRKALEDMREATHGLAAVPQRLES
jgi:kinetochore protein Nuf2